MDYKKTNAPLNTVTRDLIEMSEQTGNIYETVCVVSKRANQIAVEMKKDLEKKLQEFASMNDNLEEISENREQIEISRYYEKLPKPTLIAEQEYDEKKIYFRNPANEKDNIEYIKFLMIDIGRVFCVNGKISDFCFVHTAVLCVFILMNERIFVTL